MISKGQKREACKKVKLFGAVLFAVMIASTQVFSGTFDGLWVGTATINGVSHVNKSVPDLSFDAGLTGFKETQTLVARSNTQWSINSSDQFSDRQWTTGEDTSSNWLTQQEAPFYAYKTGTAVADNQQIVSYMRKAFNVGDTSNYANLTLRVWAQGGVDLYLNQINFIKENLTDSGYNSPANTESDSIAVYEINIPLSQLYSNAANTLAVAVHEDAQKNGIYFAMELIAQTKTHTSIDLVSKTSSGWNYSAAQTDPGINWMNELFDASAWISNSILPCYLNRGGTQLNSIQTTYFRHQFQVEDISLITGLQLKSWRDDGIVVYLNGILVFKNNMPYGEIAADTAAIYETMPHRLTQTSLPVDALKTGDNIIGVEIHSSGSDDGELYFDLEMTAGIEESLIAPKAYGWKFFPTTTTQTPYGPPDDDYMARDWKTAQYNDISWGEGQAKLGFGDGDENTEIGYNQEVWPATIYFRHTFRPSITGLDALRLLLLRDDGAVVYLNGTEIFRSNLPAGIIENETPPIKAIGPSSEGKYLVQEIDLHRQEYASLIISGDNVVAVDIHQHSSETGNTQESNTAVTPTSATFDMRVILHNDGDDNVKLLKEVYQMYKQENSNRIPVLLSSDHLIPDFQGPGLRISSIGTDFEGSSIDCTGTFSLTDVLGCSISIAENHPTNPFLHRYHPDHDNWDARYEKKYPDNKDQGAPEESFAITRTITFTFEEKYPPGCEGTSCRQFAPPGWGYSKTGGTYKEVVKGLHKDDITVTGSFELDRVSVIDRLDQ